jgi:hypothetical protein
LEEEEEIEEEEIKEEEEDWQLYIIAARAGRALPLRYGDVLTAPCFSQGPPEVICFHKKYS